MRNPPIPEWRTLVFGTKIFVTRLCCLPLFVVSLFVYLFCYYLFYSSSSVIKLHQIRTSTTFFGLLVVQHVTSQAAYVTGTYLTLAYSRHNGKNYCVLATALFDVLSSNAELTIALYWYDRDGDSYVSRRRGQGTLNFGASIVICSPAVKIQNLCFGNLTLWITVITICITSIFLSTSAFC
jgi:hypothetical protein